MTSVGIVELKKIFDEIKEIMISNRDYLIELDSALGDGDIGLTMVKGFTAASDVFRENMNPDMGKCFLGIGMAMARSAPSTMGTLLARGFIKGGKAVTGKAHLDIRNVAGFFRAFTKGIMDAGKTKPGNKTIIDVLDPASAALEKAANENKSIETGLADAYKASLQGVEDSKHMKAQHGRAAYYKEKSIGVQDPGATVGSLLLKGFAMATTK